MVFSACHIDAITVGMGQPRWMGISPVQIDAACRLYRVPPARRAQIAGDVAYMGDCVAQERNRRTG